MNPGRVGEQKLEVCEAERGVGLVFLCRGVLTMTVTPCLRSLGVGEWVGGEVGDRLYPVLSIALHDGCAA